MRFYSHTKWQREFAGTSLKAPAAVVGFQFQHTALQALFQNITFNCEGLVNCHKHCGDSGWACYLVDNNGYIVAAEDEADAGKFFGRVRGPIMSSLVKEGVFERIRIFDYQAVCSKRTNTNNSGNMLLTVRATITCLKEIDSTRRETAGDADRLQTSRLRAREKKHYCCFRFSTTQRYSRSLGIPFIDVVASKSLPKVDEIFTRSRGSICRAQCRGRSDKSLGPGQGRAYGNPISRTPMTRRFTTIIRRTR